jgi:hypothetical protein
VLFAFPEARVSAVEKAVAPLEWYLREAPEDISLRLSRQGGASSASGAGRTPRFLHFVEFLGLSPERGFGVIKGWIGDASARLAHLTLRSGTLRIVITANELTRTYRVDATGERDSSGRLSETCERVGFAAAFALPHDGHYGVNFRVDIVCESGESEWVTIEVKILPTEEVNASLMEIVSAMRRSNGLKALCAVENPAVASLGNALTASKLPVLPKAVASTYRNGVISKRANERRRASWILLLEEVSPISMPWICSFCRKELSEDEIVLVGSQSVIDAAKAMLCILTFSRPLQIGVLACDEEASKSAQLNMALEAAAGDFTIFVNQRCHLDSIPADFLSYENVPGRDLLHPSFSGIVLEVNGTIFESGAELTDMVETDSFNAFASVWARSRAEIISAPSREASAPGGLCFGIPAELARNLGAFDPRYETCWFAYADLAQRLAPFAGPVKVARDLRFYDVSPNTILTAREQARMERDLVRFAARLGGAPVGLSRGDPEGCE